MSIPLKEALKGRTFGLSRHIKNEAGAKKGFMRAFPCGDKLRAGAKRLTGFTDCPRNIYGINLAWAFGMAIDVTDSVEIKGQVTNGKVYGSAKSPDRRRRD